MPNASHDQHKKVVKKNLVTNVASITVIYKPRPCHYDTIMLVV